jgi:hypothetical protein
VRRESRVSLTMSLTADGARIDERAKDASIMLDACLDQILAFVGGGGAAAAAAVCRPAAAQEQPSRGS